MSERQSEKPLAPGERLAWTSKEGRSVVLQRTDAGLTWTVETRSTSGQTIGHLLVYSAEAAARATARFIAETIRDLESVEVAA